MNPLFRTFILVWSFLFDPKIPIVRQTLFLIFLKMFTLTLYLKHVSNNTSSYVLDNDKNIVNKC